MEEAKQYVRKDEHGTYRVGNTRILLDLVIGSYDRGYSPEFIRQQYPSLDLEQIYGAITWYLAHVEEMKSYMAEARGHADPVYNDPSRPLPSVVERLRAIKDQQKVVG